MGFHPTLDPFWDVWYIAMQVQACALSNLHTEIRYVFALSIAEKWNFSDSMSNEANTVLQKGLCNSYELIIVSRVAIQYDTVVCFL